MTDLTKIKKINYEITKLNVSEIFKILIIKKKFLN